MRAAAVKKIWKNLRLSRKRKVSRIDFSWSMVPGLNDGSLSVTAPITLICGENGAGKSRIMHALYRAFRSTTDGFPAYRFFRRADGEVCTLAVSLDGDSESLSAPQVSDHFFPDGELERIRLFCPAMAVAAQLEEIRNDVAFGERLEGAVSRSFNDAQLKHASQILARSYSSVEVFEVEATSDSEAMRYFRAKSHGVYYDSNEMGEGELAIFNMLDLLAEMAEGSVVLIEEPESYLSPRAQSVFMDVLAEISGSSGLTCIVSSHSGVVAKRLNLDEIFFVSRGSGGVALESPVRKTDLVERLGLLSPKATIFFVEDRAGRCFCRTILDIESNQLGGRGEFVVCGGSGNAKKAVMSLPREIYSVAHVAILDGDERGKVDDPRVLFLPGNAGPDKLLHDFAIGLDAASLALEIGVDGRSLALALNKTEGLDSHDWPEAFGRLVSCSEDEVIRRLTTAWASRNREDVVSLVRGIEAAVAE